MGWFRSKKGYDRSRILEDARKAARKGDHARAIAHYERVQEVEPGNTDVLRRLATERALAGQRAEAWRDYRRAGEALAGRGFVEQAIGVYREAANHLSDEVAVWESLAELEVARKRTPDAVAVLVEGCRHFRSRRTRQHALSLLERAHRLDPTHFEASFKLASLLAKSGARPRALRLLDELTRSARGRNLRRVRSRQLWLSPTPAAAWRWLAALATT
jgi:tetratricopeptide (TPR) repeat protein